MKQKRMAFGAFLAVLFALSCLFNIPLPAQAASKTPTIAVAPFTSTPKTKQKRLQAQRARTAIVKALGGTGKSEFLSWTAVSNQAKRQYIKGAALENPKRMGPVVRKLGGDVLVMGSIDKRGKLTLTITDTTGKKLWVKSVPLKQGRLSPSLAKKFAKAIDAAAQAAVAGSSSRRKSPPISDTSEDDGDLDDTPKKSSRVKSPPPDDDDQDADDWGRPKNRKSARDLDDEEESRPRHRQRDRDDDDGWNGQKNDAWGGSSSSSSDDSDDYGYRADSDIGPAIFKVSADLSLTFRKYKFCNGVTTCGDIPVEGAGHSVDFSTSTPYLGFRLGLELFPAARVSNRYVRGLGVVGSLRMNPGISVSYTLGGEETELKGKEIDFNVAATYRFYYNAGFLKNAWIGLELGYMRYGFTIDDNPFFSSASHGGFAMGLDAGFPLHRYVAVDLNFTFQPSTSPDDDERSFFVGKDGDASGVAANGKGLKFDIGLEFPFSSHIGCNVKFDFARYWSDFKRYADNGSDIIPASASEQYIGISLGLTGKF